jgi:hypothetical protein
LRGKPWSIDEERQLRMLIEEGKSFEEISKIMGKSILSIKGKFFNSGLNSIVVATRPHGCVATTTATTTTPDMLMTDPAAASRPISIASAVAVNFSGLDLKLPEELPSVEDELKVLIAAIEALRSPNLPRGEVSRLRTLVLAIKIYEEKFPLYLNYRRVEAELLELRRQLGSEINKS